MTGLPSSLLVRPRSTTGEYTRIVPETAHWEHLGFAARLMSRGDLWQAQTGSCEYGLVVLSGRCRIESSRGSWPALGRRPSVFAGMPYALYLPPDTGFT